MPDEHRITLYPTLKTDTQASNYHHHHPPTNHPRSNYHRSPKTPPTNHPRSNYHRPQTNNQSTNSSHCHHPLYLPITGIQPPNQSTILFLPTTNQPTNSMHQLIITNHQPLINPPTQPTIITHYQSTCNHQATQHPLPTNQLPPFGRVVIRRLDMNSLQ